MRLLLNIDLVEPFWAPSWVPLEPEIEIAAAALMEKLTRETQVSRTQLRREVYALWLEASDHFQTGVSQPCLANNAGDRWFTVRLDASDVIEFLSILTGPGDPEAEARRRQRHRERWSELEDFDAYVDIDLCDAQDPARGWPPHMMDAFLDELWLALNIALPGSLCLATTKVIDGFEDYTVPPLSGRLLSDALHSARTRSWPALRPLSFKEVWHWLHEGMTYDLEVAETPLEIGLVTLLQVARRDPNDSANIVSVAQAIESLFGSNKDAVLSAIRPRIEAVLGRPEHRTNWLSKFYDARSRIAHGAGPMWRPRSSVGANARLPRLDRLAKDLAQPTSDGLAVLLAALQDLASTDSRGYRFSHVVERVQ